MASDNEEREQHWVKIKLKILDLASWAWNECLVFCLAALGSRQQSNMGSDISCCWQLIILSDPLKIDLTS